MKKERLKYISIIGFVIGIFSILALLDQNALFAAGITGITIQVLAFLLMIWARLTFGRRSFHPAANPTEGGLVTTGPYRLIRHPIYAALLFFIWAGILSHSNMVNLLPGVTATLGIVLRMLSEERLVTERYPEYLNYAARTKRIIPYVL